MKATPNSPTTVSGLLLHIEPGPPGPEAAERWAARAEVLAAWLAAQWTREQVAESDSPPACLDPAPCAATPRQDVTGAPEAA